MATELVIPDELNHRWERYFITSDCQQVPEPNSISALAIIFSNLLLLLPVIYAGYILGILRVVRQIRVYRNDIRSVNLATLYPDLSRETLDILSKWRGRDPSPLLGLSLIWIFLAFAVSVMYHTCQAAEVCKITNFITSHTLDLITANYTVAILVLNYLERYNTGWVISASAGYLIGTVLLVLSFPCTYISSVLVLVVGLVLGVINIVIVREGKLDTFARFRLVDIVLSLVFLSTGVLFFVVDNYSISHPMWHALSGLGILATLSGTNGDLPYAPTFFQFLKGLPLMLYDGVLLPSYQFYPRSPSNLERIWPPIFRMH